MKTRVRVISLSEQGISSQHFYRKISHPIRHPFVESHLGCIASMDASNEVWAMSEAVTHQLLVLPPFPHPPSPPFPQKPSRYLASLDTVSSLPPRGAVCAMAAALISARGGFRMVCCISSTLIAAREGTQRAGFSVARRSSRALNLCYPQHSADHHSESLPACLNLCHTQHSSKQHSESLALSL